MCFFIAPIPSSLKGEERGSYFWFCPTKLHDLILIERGKLSGKASAGLCLLSCTSKMPLAIDMGYTQIFTGFSIKNKYLLV